jgi:hypothetical protein
VARGETGLRGGELAVEIGEVELSRQLSQQLLGRPLAQTPLGTASVDSVQVELHPGRAEVSGTARLGGVDAPFTMIMTALAEPSGSVKIALSEARLSGLLVPEVARAELEGQVQREVDRLIGQQAIRVRSVELTEGRLRAVGSAPR